MTRSLKEHKMFIFIIAAILGALICINYAHGKEEKEEANKQALCDAIAEQDAAANELVEVRAAAQEAERLQQEELTRQEELRKQEEMSRGYNRGAIFEITAYDLSVESCGKSPGHPSYGITASGESLAGHSLESARAIAVDPSVIPLGASVRIHFIDENMQCYDGIYRAVDTGGAVRGNHIDLFAGENAGHIARQIGRRRAHVEIVR